MKPVDGLRMVTCTDATCRLRFPVVAPQDPRACPMCGAGLHADPAHPARLAPNAPPPTMAVAGLLDNVRSVANVGAMLRTADATGMEHVDLVGITAPGDHDNIDKTALGAQHSVSWSHHRNGPDCVATLRDRGWRIWALESAVDAAPLSRAVADLAAEDGCGPQRPPDPVATSPRIVVVVGHEVAGVDPAILAVADRVVAIPMRGMKDSLNVATAFGIAAWALTTTRATGDRQ